MSSDNSIIEVEELPMMAQAEKQQSKQRRSTVKVAELEKKEQWRRESSIIKVAELEKMAQAEKEQWQRRSIYKLPAFVTDINKTAYTPRIVSFGPYHHKNENLKEMESHKERALNRYLKRSEKDNNDCRECLMEIVGELMDAYDGLDSELYNKEKPNAFLDIMIRDGIFLLEIFGDREQKAVDYANNDPIFSEHGDFYIIPHIKRDMLLLENQIPIKVLQRLYRLQNPEDNIGIKEENKPKVNACKERMQTTWDACRKRMQKICMKGEDAKKSMPGEDEKKGKEDSKKQRHPANVMVFKFFFPNKLISAMPDNSLHILDMYRTVILGPDPKPKGKKKQNPNIIGGEDIIRSAMELQKVGVKIKKSKIGSIRSISFEDGKLCLPMIIVDDTTETLYLNLIAFERFHVGAGKEVTSYAFFMDNIVDGKEDIRLLHTLDIIQNGIGSDDAAANLFNSLSKDISLDKSSPLATVYATVNAYCKRRMPKYRAALYYKYFTNPWTIIAFIAAIIYFGLTTTQTSYAVMDFYKPDNKTSH